MQNYELLAKRQAFSDEISTRFHGREQCPSNAFKSANTIVRLARCMRKVSRDSVAVFA
jgi:hypothetical protein